MVIVGKMLLTATSVVSAATSVVVVKTVTRWTKCVGLWMVLQWCMMVAVVSDSGDSGPPTQGAIDFPPKLDGNDIDYFSSENDLEGLYWALTNVFRRSERNPNLEEIVHALPDTIVSRGGGSTYTTEYKLRADLEQAQYLVDAGCLEDNAAKLALFRETVIPTYQKVLARIPPLSQLQKTGGLYAFTPQDFEDGIGAVYNKALHMVEFDESKDPPLDTLLSDSLDVSAIEEQWLEKEAQGSPGIVVIDNVLSPEALRRLRRILMEDTVWYQTKMPLQFGGYVGAYLDDGLHNRLLLQLAWELRAKLPRLIGQRHPLQYLWAYKYDSQYTGINLHADQAAVNVNLWITPDEANMDADSGGLVVFTAKPPAHWDFAEYNTRTERVRDELLRPTHFANVTIPHRANRAVLFDSALFHQTDAYQFQTGYQNRRINLTLLYGKMQTTTSASANTGTSARQDL